MKQILNGIKLAIQEGYDWLMRKLAKRVINEAYVDGQNAALITSLNSFHRARREDLWAITEDIKKCGEGFEFKDTDPALAYKLGKQIGIDVVTDRAKGVS